MNGDDIFDLQLFQNYIDHNHGIDLPNSSVDQASKYAIRGTKRLLKQRLKDKNEALKEQNET